MNANLKRETLYEAVQAFLGPLMAEGCRVIDEWPAGCPVFIKFGPCEVEMTLEDLKRLDRAYHQAFDAKQARAERRLRGSLFDAREHNEMPERAG